MKRDMKGNFKAIIRDHREMLSLFSKANKTNNVKVVYIAGKVTGLPYPEVVQKFRTRQLMLEAGGYLVINPCDHIKETEDWDTAMKLCLYLLQFANCINLLHDWQDSKGAMIEKEHAEVLGIELLPFPESLLLGKEFSNV